MLPFFIICLMISIHSTTRVETMGRVSPWQPGRIFQSTPPRGWRRIILVLLHPAEQISIHSTTRVETLRSATPSSRSTGFQSTPPRGWRPARTDGSRSRLSISIHSTTRVETITFFSVILSFLFQSTPPRGWRPRRVFPQMRCSYFNPLHHEGGDSNTTQ